MRFAKATKYYFRGVEWMKKVRIKQVILRRAIIVLLALIVAEGILFSGLIVTVNAAVQAPSATLGNNLSSDPTQSAQVQALGLSADQPARIDPSGKEVNKNLNPLGSNNLIFNRVYQLAIATGGTGNSLQVYNNPVGASNINTADPVIPGMTPPAFADSSWDGAERALTAADVDGNGTQEVITAGLIPTTSGKAALHILIADYNSRKIVPVSGNNLITINSKDFTAVSSVDYTSLGVEPLLGVTAGDFDHDGKDEVAVTAGRNLYIFKVSMNAVTTVSSVTFSRTSNVVKMNDGSLPNVEVDAFDANGDGFTELLVAMGYYDPSAVFMSRLLIYNGTNLSTPAANINLTPSVTIKNITYSDAFLSPNVDIGDVFGNGEKEIVVGGKLKTTGAVYLTYIKFNPETEIYDAEQAINSRGYLLFENMSKVKSGDIGLKCVYLKTPVPGDPEYLVIGGFILKYNQVNDTFEKQDLASETNNSGVDANSNNTCQGNITDINFSNDNDSTYILGTLTGNFDGNTEGKEQIIMLHYNHWYDNNFVYVTLCSMDDSGNLNVHLMQEWKEIPKHYVIKSREEHKKYIYPAICAPDVFNNGTRLVFEPDKSKFMFSNPTVVTVLGATPYYKELKDMYSALYNVGTTYGTENETSSSISNGVTASVGVSFGFSQDINFIVKIGSVSLETEVKNSFSYKYTSAVSISKSISFTNYYSDDAAVVMAIPYDLYYYMVYTPDGKVSEMVVNVPYSPITTIMPVTDYNKAAAEIKDAPIITPQVLKHTVGNPRSYPQSSAGLSNVPGKDVLLGGTSNNENECFIAAGTGNSSVEQSITTSTTTEKSFDYELSIDVKFNVNVFGITSGVSAGAGYTHNATISSTKSTVRTGSVASVPQGYGGYNFKWCLAAYNYNLQAGDQTQECTVISYLVRPIGSFPPAVPANFTVGSRNLNMTAFKWDPAEGAAGYRLSRSTSITGPFTAIKDLTGKDTASYTDTELSSGQTYYYELLAYAAKESIPTDPLQVLGLTVTGVGIKTQPKLVYNDGDALNLSSLSVTLRISDGSTQDVAFADFSKYDISSSIADGTKLNAGDSGIPITVKYVSGNQSANTNNLTVNAKSPYDITLSVKFKVGTTVNTTVLVPDQQLSANIELTNNQSYSQQVLVIFALYSVRGNMEKMWCKTQNINAGATTSITSDSFLLPSNVDGYTAKVFVWDGADLTSTAQTPKSAVIQMP